MTSTCWVWWLVETTVRSSRKNKRKGVDSLIPSFGSSATQSNTGRQKKVLIMVNALPMPALDQASGSSVYRWLFCGAACSQCWTTSEPASHEGTEATELIDVTSHQATSAVYAGFGGQPGSGSWTTAIDGRNARIITMNPAQPGADYFAAQRTGAGCGSRAEVMKLHARTNLGTGERAYSSLVLVDSPHARYSRWIGQPGITVGRRPGPTERHSDAAETSTARRLRHERSGSAWSEVERVPI
jgi:hypothetical protein